MSSYRVAWAAVTVFVVGAASVHDIAAGGLARMVSLGVGFGLFGAFLAFTLAEERADRRALVRRSALWSGFAVAAADALATTWGGPGVVVGAALLATTPSVISLARQGLVSRSSRRMSDTPEAMSVLELHRRWDCTTAEVARTTTTVSRRLALVEERRRLLDELQLRDPDRFDAWLVTAMPDRRHASPWSRGP